MREAEQEQGAGDTSGTQAETTGEPAHGAGAGARATAEAIDLGRVRELIIQAHPAVVPELIVGNTMDELLASVQPAEAAFARIRDGVTQQQQAAGQAQAAAAAGSVPAGQPGRTFVINVEELSPGAKIAEGLKRAKRS